MDTIKWEKCFIEYLKQNPSDDKSHDLGHFKRVWKTACHLMTQEIDKLVVLAAAYFHDIVSYPKNDPRRSQSSRDAAIKAEEILIKLGFPNEKIQHVKHCIEAHSFSAGIIPKTIEAKIVQDADRMEALGAIGIARTFYVAGRLGSKLFHEDDPMATKRNLDDSAYALDHFKIKLLKLPNTMQTKAGKIEAQKRAMVLTRFSEDLLSEL